MTTELEPGATPLNEQVDGALEKMASGEWRLILEHPDPSQGTSLCGFDVGKEIARRALSAPEAAHPGVDAKPVAWLVQCEDQNGNDTWSATTKDPSRLYGPNMPILPLYLSPHPASRPATCPGSDDPDENRPHEWFEYKGMTCCRACGIIRNENGNRSCKGIVSVGLRATPRPAAPTDGQVIQLLNNCGEHAISALRYLARYDRPIGGEQTFNAADLEDTALYLERELKRLGAAIPAAPTDGDIGARGTQEYTLRAMGRNYRGGNLWDGLDREAVLKAADEIKTLRAALSDAWHQFKNFHRLLCERFGYCHDPKDWVRDQVSLIEHIAAIGAGSAPEWTREDLAVGLAALDGIVLRRIKSTVGPADDANNWREYLGRADDLMAHLSAAPGEAP